MTIIPFYAGLLTLIFITLSLRIIFLRNTLKIGLGDLGNEKLFRAIRVHSNFVEYVPMSILLFSFIEFKGGSLLLCHGLCGSLIIGRVTHAYGVSKIKETFYFRQIGMALTFTPMIAGALYLSLGI